MTWFPGQVRKEISEWAKGINEDELERERGWGERRWERRWREEKKEEKEAANRINFNVRNEESKRETFIWSSHLMPNAQCVTELSLSSYSSEKELIQEWLKEEGRERERERWLDGEERGDEQEEKTFQDRRAATPSSSSSAIFHPDLSSLSLHSLFLSLSLSLFHSNFPTLSSYFTTSKTLPTLTNLEKGSLLPKSTQFHFSQAS